MAERDTEDRILDAAHAVFLRHGTAGARMQDIADEAGVNKALLHYYFRTKDQLGQAVFRRALSTLLPQALRVLRSDDPIEVKVRDLVVLETEILLRNPFLPGFLLSELTHHPERIREVFETAAGMDLRQLGAEVSEHLSRQLDDVEGADAGAIPPQEFLMNLISLVIFPHAARPLFRMIFGLEDEAYDEVMRRRRETVPEFFLKGLRR